MLIKKHGGFTITELLIGTALGLLVLAAMGNFLMSVATTSATTIKTVRLDHDMEAALNLMAHDIRDAGYWSNANTMVKTGANTNPFMVTGTTDIMTPTAGCILFTYDSDLNGLLPVLGAGTSDERYGYRLSGGAIQVRATADGSFSCNGGTWENITDPTLMTITTLTFTLTPTVVALTSPATSESIIIRNVSIVMVGRLNEDATITKSFSTNIRLRNDKYQP